MIPLAFFQSSAVERILSRAAICSAVPLSLHYFEGDAEESRILGFGQCAACRFVSARPEGRQACHTSRARAAQSSMRRGRGAAFVCHMGFGCVSASALSYPEAAGFVLTFGPFFPAEEPRGLEQGAETGLKRLGLTQGESFSLRDIHVVPAGALPEMAGWTVEALDRLWREVRSDSISTAERETEESHASASPQRTGSPIRVRNACHGVEIAAALAGGNQPQARALLRAALEECRGSARTRIGVRRARMLAAVSFTVEAAERAELSAGLCWERFGPFVGEVAQARTDEDLMSAGMRVLSGLRRRAQHNETAAPHDLVELNRLVMARFPDKVTLNEIAEELGQHPTAITHRLQRKFGMSFSEYVGRLRIDKAKELLRRTQLGAGEVAVRVGVGDASNFNKLFRKFEGMTPLEYRERFRKKR